MQSRNQGIGKPCDFAERLQRSVDAILETVNGQTSPKDYAQAHDLLLRQKLSLEAELRELGRFHYAAAYGPRHRCVPAVYADAVFALNRAVLQKPLPAPAPPPPSKPRSLTDVVEGFAGRTDDDNPNGQ